MWSNIHFCGGLSHYLSERGDIHTLVEHIEEPLETLGGILLLRNSSALFGDITLKRLMGNTQKQLQFMEPLSAVFA